MIATKSADIFANQKASGFSVYFKMKDSRIIDLQVQLFDFLHPWPLRPDAVGAE